tara:strand:+ start:629 stop:1615 length:987 start_codon:yes stop_codon:yes gene_type:complete
MAGNIPGTKYSTSSFLSKFGNIAQTSQYRSHVVFPQGVYNFLRDARDVPQALLNEVGMMCKATSIPGSSLATHDVNDYYGITQKHAYRRQFDGTIDLTFYIDSNYSILYMFEGWLEYILSVNGKSPKNRNTYYVAEYPDNYRASLFLYKFNKDQNAQWNVVNPFFEYKGSIAYEFIGAFPQNISSTTVSYDPSQNLEFTVTFAYERYLTDRTGGRMESRSPNRISGRQRQPLLDAPERNPSGKIRRNTDVGTRWVGENSTWVNRWDEVIAPRVGGKPPILNAETGAEPGQGNQATSGRNVNTIVRSGDSVDVADQNAAQLAKARSASE